MNQLMTVKKLRHESLWLLVVMYVLLLTNTAWFIYGNVIYYKNKDYCGEVENAGSSPELTPVRLGATDCAEDTNRQRS